MSGFLADIAAEPAVVRSVIAAADGRLDEPLRAAASILRRHPERPIVVTGMGSSLAAGRVLHSVLVPTGRTVILEDAGELLHYGLGAAANVGCLVAISQSGRSVETVRVIEQLRERGETPIIAIVNDPDSPVAAGADVVLDVDAGVEAAVATRTFVATVAVLALLAGRVAPGGPSIGDLARAADEMEIQLHETEGVRAARHLAGGRGRGLVIVGRGPGLGAADYGALTIKEAAAVPAEAMSGGAFRHGPLELASADVGFVVLAPAGRTAHLAAAVAREVAGRGRPTWLIASADLAHQQGDPPELLGTPIPDLPEALAQLTCAVPLQQAAGELARAAGREAGVTIVATKVTDRE
jgi:glucosamine--fructose-6-phosphate aminotransferase (isomerizing)